MSGHEVADFIRTFIDWVSAGIELLAVVVILTAVIMVAVSHGTIRYVFRVGKPGAHANYTHPLGRPLRLGLDLMVAGDLVRTAALELTLYNIATLGLLVLVRTFLSWSLTVEMEGHWPWQARSEKNNQGGNMQTDDNITQKSNAAGKGGQP